MAGLRQVRLMKLCVRRLGVDWRERYGHEVLIAESYWISRRKNKRKATFNGFLGAMEKHGSATAFRMALCTHPTWLP